MYGRWRSRWNTSWRGSNFNMAKKHAADLVYYGPHPCQNCDKDGKKGTMIVKAGNGAPGNLAFEFPKEYEAQHVAGQGGPYPNTHPKLRWKTHKHVK